VCENLAMTLARPLLWGVMLVSAILLAVRACIGPYYAVNSPMNAEGAFAMAALLLLICGCRVAQFTIVREDPFEIPPVWSAAAAFVVVLAAFLPTLRLPLLFDDYTHTAGASPEFWKHLLTVPSGDGSFRPIGLFSYHVDAFWAGHHPSLWRLSNLLLHLASSVMVFFLGQRMGLASWTAGFAAMLFGVHGSRMESAGWVAARFDLLAGFFVLAGLLLLFRYLDNSRVWLLIAAHAMCLLGLLSKEAAFVFPVLTTVLLWRQLSPRILGSVYLLTAMVFAYRWSLLGGRRIFRKKSGEPIILFFNATRTVKALLWRLWATLWFPINWSHEPNLPLALAVTAMLAASVWVFWKRPAIHWKALAFTLAAALPVQHLLLIGPDLSGSRVLYLPSIGFALLLAFALQSVAEPRATAVAALAIVIFHLVAFNDNLQLWTRASIASESACRQVGEVMLGTGRQATVTDLPRSMTGVFFLRNGFESCVEWNTGAPARRVHVVDPPEKPSDSDDMLLFRWDVNQGIVRVR